MDLLARERIAAAASNEVLSAGLDCLDNIADVNSVGFFTDLTLLLYTNMFEAERAFRFQNADLLNWYHAKTWALKRSANADPDLREMALTVNDFNPGFFSDVLQPGVIQFREMKLGIISDGANLDDERTPRELRTYFGIDPFEQKLSAQANISEVFMPARSRQHEHHHASNPEMIIALDGVTTTYIFDQNNRVVERYDLVPGQGVIIYQNVQHTLANESFHATGHAAVKFPVSFFGERRNLPPSEPSFEHAVFALEEGPRHVEHDNRVFEVGITDQIRKTPPYQVIGALVIVPEVNVFSHSNGYVDAAYQHEGVTPHKGNVVSTKRADVPGLLYVAELEGT